MANKKNNKNMTHNELKKKSNEQKTSNVKDMLEIRKRIERDYEEDVMDVSFNTSKETTRCVLAKQPTNSEMINILEMSADANRFEQSKDSDALYKMLKTYKKLGKIASDLSIDPKLDEDFWNNKVSSQSLQNFISALIITAQSGGGSVSKKDMENFR